MPERMTLANVLSRLNGGDLRMFDTETTSLLRAVLDEVCATVSRYETAARTHVASKILEAAARGETSLED
jgi:hypothetical protein